MKALALLLALAPVYAGPITFGTNLIVNGDAESGAGSNDGSVVASIPGWSTLNGNFTVVQYGASGGFPTLGDPGPANRGNNFFAGGPGTNEGSGSQALDISSISTQVDAGLITYDLSAYLGGWQSQDDEADISLWFWDQGNNLVGFYDLTGPTAAQRGGVTGLFFTSNSGSVPAGTRSVEFDLNMFWTSGSYVDGYADNLSFALNAASVSGVPEPGSIALVALGLAATAAFSKYRYSCSARTRRSTDR